MDSIGLAAGKAAAIGGGVSTVLLGMSAYEVASCVGALVAVCGLFVQWYYHRKRDRRELVEHRLRVERYERDMEQAGRELAALVPSADK